MSTKKTQSSKKPAATKARSSARNRSQPTANDWHAVWMQAVARSWRDPEFEKQLKENPRQALKDGFNFKLPEGINLKVVPSSSRQDPSEWKLLSADVEMPLPPKPKDVDDHAVALSSLTNTYNRDHCCGSPCC